MSRRYSSGKNDLSSTPNFSSILVFLACIVVKSDVFFAEHLEDIWDVIYELFCFFEIEKVDLFQSLDPLEVVGQRILLFDIHEQGVVGL